MQHRTYSTAWQRFIWDALNLLVLYLSLHVCLTLKLDCSSEGAWVGVFRNVLRMKRIAVKLFLVCNAFLILRFPSLFNPVEDTESDFGEVLKLSSSSLQTKECDQPYRVAIHRLLLASADLHSNWGGLKNRRWARVESERGKLEKWGRKFGIDPMRTTNWFIYCPTTTTCRDRYSAVQGCQFE